MRRDEHFHVLSRKEGGIFDQVASKVRQLGFEFCAFGMKLPFPLAAPKIILISDYPADWRARYEQQGYLAVDPTVKHGLRSNAALVWSADLFHDAGELWDDATAHGLSHGMGLARRLPNGAIGMLNFARGFGRIGALEASELVPELEMLTEMLVVTEADAVTRRQVPESLSSLSEREKEILRWTADGKTSSEVGQILNLSTATVNFHINKSLLKLNAVNKTQAVVKAVLLGLLA